MKITIPNNELSLDYDTPLGVNRAMQWAVGKLINPTLNMNHSTMDRFEVTNWKSNGKDLVKVFYRKGQYLPERVLNF